MGLCIGSLYDAVQRGMRFLGIFVHAQFVEIPGPEEEIPRCNRAKERVSLSEYADFSRIQELQDSVLL